MGTQLGGLRGNLAAYYKSASEPGTNSGYGCGAGASAGLLGRNPPVSHTQAHTQKRSFSCISVHLSSPIPLENAWDRSCAIQVSTCLYFNKQKFQLFLKFALSSLFF